MFCRVLEIKCSYVIICLGEKLLYVMLFIEIDFFCLEFELCMNGFIRLIFIYIYVCNI